MSLPLDVEDVVGMALADVLKRVGLLVIAVLGGAWLGALGVLVGEIVAWRVETGNWDMGFWEFSLWRAMLIPLRPVFSLWGVPYLPLLIAAAFYFGKAAAPGVRALATFLTLVGFFAVVGRGEPGWFAPSYFGVLLGATVVSDPQKLYSIMIGIGLVMWVGLSGSVWFFAILWERRQRMRAEAHLIEVAQASQLKREEIKKRTGTAVADREFAVEEESNE